MSMFVIYFNYTERGFSEALCINIFLYLTKKHHIIYGIKPSSLNDKSIWKNIAVNIFERAVCSCFFYLVEITSMSVFMYAYLYVYLWACMIVYIMWVCVHVWVLNMYVWVCMRVCMYVCVHEWLFLRMLCIYFIYVCV